MSGVCGFLLYISSKMVGTSYHACECPNKQQLGRRQCSAGAKLTASSLEIWRGGRVCDQEAASWLRRRGVTKDLQISQEAIQVRQLPTTPRARDNFYFELEPLVRPCRP